jgi:hypothetical protein
LLKSILGKKHIYEEKEDVANLLRDKQNLYFEHPKEPRETSGLTKVLEKKLDDAVVAKGLENGYGSMKNLLKSPKNSSVSKLSNRVGRVHKKANSKQTL